MNLYVKFLPNIWMKEKMNLFLLNMNIKKSFTTHIKFKYKT